MANKSTDEKKETAQKKSTASAKTSAKKKNGSKVDVAYQSYDGYDYKKNVKNESDTDTIKCLAMSAVLCALALFIVFCYGFPELCGFVGGWIKNVMFGLFAGGAILVPIFLLLGAFCLKSDVQRGMTYYRLIFSFVAVVIVSTMLHAIFSGTDATIGALVFSDAAKFYEQGKFLVGGGVIGGFFGALIMECVGITGTIIFTVLMILVSGIFLVGHTPRTFIKRVRFLYFSACEKSAIKKKAKEEAAAKEREERRRVEAEAMVREERKRAQAQARAEEERIKAEEEEKEIERMRRETQEHKAKAQEIRRESLSAEETFRTTNKKKRADIEVIFEDEPIETPQSKRKAAKVDHYEKTYSYDEYGYDDDKEFRGESVAEFWKNNEVEATAKKEVIVKEEEEYEFKDEDVPPQYIEEAEAIEPEEDGEYIETVTVSSDEEPEAEFEEEAEKDDLLGIDENIVPEDDEDEDDYGLEDAQEDEAKLPDDAIPWEDIVGEGDKTNEVKVTEELDPIAEELRRTLDGARKKLRGEDAEASLAAAEAIAKKTEVFTEDGDDEEIDIEEKDGEDNDMDQDITDMMEDVSEEEEEVIPEVPKYVFPPLDLLKRDPGRSGDGDSDELCENADKLIATLKSFNVRAKIVDVSRGPTITRYEIALEAGTRVRTINNLVDDIAYALATDGVRIEGVVRGKSAIGIEVPNQSSETVYLRSLLEDKKFTEAKSPLTTALGKSVSGENIYLDISKMPHLLIAGTTGSGKSVCINTMLISLLYKASPDEVKLVLVDPKKVELNVYNGIPHLLVPVVFDPKKAAGALHWCVTEMERRFDLIESMNVRNLDGYNKAIESDPTKEKLPRIVIVIDELADLMMTASNEVETSICRIAQKARAAGMHLIIGTQRPSVDIITGLIKANVPSRIAFTVMSQIDSRTIIDMPGAEKLIGRGDMLFAPTGSNKPTRAQGAFVSDSELENIIKFIKENAQKAEYSDDIIKRIEKEAALCGKKGKARDDAEADAIDTEEEEDPKLDSAIKLAVESGKISTSLIQRKLSLGYGRAAKLIDVMERRGIVAKQDGQRPREVLITKEQYLEMQMRSEGAAGNNMYEEDTLSRDDFPEDEI